ncbi:thiazole tautomerase TenI [Evansella sp. AB-rgal1]|uniref:thiazole tautomerase TenI n=1 Tax=Evansella sp. AB-rgal1 TaxID=3242696 RepID=UPI00359E7307
MANTKKWEFHLISNGKLSLEEFAIKAGMLEPYVRYFHLREKQLTANQLANGIELLLREGVPKSKIMVNDRVDVAAAFQVAGTQLAYHSLSVERVKQTFPTLKVGTSVHSVEEAKIAEANGADYLLYGHIFPSKSKPNLEPKGTSQLKQLTELITIPVIAIGGITPENIKDTLEAGAKGVAVMSGILEAKDPVTMIKSYIERGK